MLGSVAVAFGLTLVFGPLIARAIFVFLYGAVAVSGMYAGLRGGVIASLLSVALVSYYIVPPKNSFSVGKPEDTGSLIVFMIMSSLLSALVSSLRVARRAAEESNARMATQAVEMTAQQNELRSLTEQLEDSNVELESAVEDSNAARDEAIASEGRLRLLDEASRVLASSLEYEATVAAVARFAVPMFAIGAR